MSFSSMVAEAILAPEDSSARNDVQRQMECKMAAMHTIMCHCGSILDQATVCVLRVENAQEDDADTIVTCCPACRRTADQHIVKMFRDGKLRDGDTLTWLTWDSEDVVDVEQPVKRLSAVAGLQVVKQPHVKRGPGKYRVVHVASDRYLSEHSSKKKAEELLAVLEPLADWTLSMTALKKTLSRKQSQEIAGFVKYYA